jgi:hypothetical protein
MLVPAIVISALSLQVASDINALARSRGGA